MSLAEIVEIVVGTPSSEFFFDTQCPIHETGPSESHQVEIPLGLPQLVHRVVHTIVKMGGTDARHGHDGTIISSRCWGNGVRIEQDQKVRSHLSVHRVQWREGGVSVTPLSFAAVVKARCAESALQQGPHYSHSGWVWVGKQEGNAPEPDVTRVHAQKRYA